MFEEIKFSNLKIGKEYFITGEEIDIIYYRGYFEGYLYNIAKFHSLLLVYPKTYYYADYKTFHSYPKRYYYEFVSKKKEIQEAMESRALNLILQNIIGDKCFEW
jgi:hypothetical protein